MSQGRRLAATLRWIGIVVGLSAGACSVERDGASAELRVLVLGDSLSWSEDYPHPGGPGWGRAASAPERDWVHLAAEALPARMWVPVSEQHCVDAEGRPSFLACAGVLDRFGSWQPDVVIAQVSEHFRMLDGLRTDAELERWHRRVAAFAKEHCAQLIAIGRWGFEARVVERTDSLVRGAIGPRGEVISLAGILSADWSIEGSVDRWHPGDRAHEAIARRVTRAIREGADRRGCAP